MNRAPLLLLILLIVLVPSGCADDPTTPPAQPAPAVSPQFQVVGPIAQVSAGFSHTCAVRADLTVECWGQNTWGEADAPAGTFTQVSAAGATSCAVTTDGGVVCWGRDDSGQASPPSGTNFTQVEAGFGHSCAVATDGSVQCWGSDQDGRSSPPAGSFTQVSLGHVHGCALATDGSVQCWGNDVFGQSSPPAGEFTQVSAGAYHTCALAVDETVHCWGYDGWGQASPPAGTFTQVSAGKGNEGHTCALASDRTVRCWGIDEWGMISPPAGSFMQVSAGGYHTCAVAIDETVHCWGDNWWGQTGELPSAFTREDSEVRVTPPEGNDGQSGDVTLTFETVGGSGQTTVTTSETGPEPPEGFQLGDPPVYYEITTTATYSGNIEICIDYSAQSFGGSEPELRHFEGGVWVLVELSSHDTENDIICGIVTSLSPFVLVQVNTAPVASVGGPYTGDEGSPVALSFSGHDGDGDALTYDWDLGDGTAGTGDTPPTAHTYLDNGTYAITLTASDPYGGTHTATTEATIANVAPSVGPVAAPSEPVAVGTGTTVGAEFTDPGINDSHTADIDWGDGSRSPAIVSETAGSGSVTASHGYPTAGVYTVKLTVTDKDGATDESVYEFVVVYDPSDGFVTGGGWITSAPGAYVPDPSVEGKATFGFVSRYRQGAGEPTGNTEFQFRAGDVDFHSTSYEWLIVTGSEYARLKGSGTINGTGDYRFMLWAGDGSPDTFRIRIWEEDESPGLETVIYDNGFSQAIGGGSIVIHTK